MWKLVKIVLSKKCYSGYLWHASLFYRNLVSAKWHGPQNLFLWTYLIKNHSLLFCFLKLITSCYFHLFQSCYLIIFFCFIFCRRSMRLLAWHLLIKSACLTDDAGQNLGCNWWDCPCSVKASFIIFHQDWLGPCSVILGRSHASCRSLIMTFSESTMEQHTETGQNLSSYNFW